MFTSILFLFSSIFYFSYSCIFFYFNSSSFFLSISFSSLSRLFSSLRFFLSSLSFLIREFASSSCLCYSSWSSFFFSKYDLSFFKKSSTGSCGNNASMYDIVLYLLVIFIPSFSSSSLSPSFSYNIVEYSSNCLSLD